MGEVGRPPAEVLLHPREPAVAGPVRRRRRRVEEEQEVPAAARPAYPIVPAELLNTAGIVGAAALAADAGAQLLCVPAPLFTGVQPTTLIEYADFEHDLIRSLRELAASQSPILPKSPLSQVHAPNDLPDYGSPAALKYETAEEEKKRLEKEERERILAAARSGEDPSGPPPQDEQPPSYQEF